MGIADVDFSDLGALARPIILVIERKRSGQQLARQKTVIWQTAVLKSGG